MYGSDDEYDADTIQSPSAFVSLLPLLANSHFMTLSICDSLEVLQMKVNKRAAIQAKYVPVFSQLFVPCLMFGLFVSVGKYVTMMEIHTFFASLHQFKALYMIDIQCILTILLLQ